LITDNSSKSAYFLGQLQWLSGSNRIIDNQSLPCFMISDSKEIIIVFHEKDTENNENPKKKHKTAAIWTNYSAFVKILETLFSKLNEQ
jgi:hypothetical protein